MSDERLTDQTPAPGRLPPPLPASASEQPSAGPPRGLVPPWVSGLIALPYAFVVQIAVALAGLALLAATGLALPEGLEGGPLLLSVVAYGLVIPAIWIGWRVLDGAPLVDMGHEGPLVRVLGQTVLGFVAGVAVLSAVVGLGALLGAWTLSAGGTPGVLGLQAIWIPALLVAAYFEELLLRGWIQQDFGRSRPLLGLVLSSILFAIVHGANPNLLSEGLLGAALALFNIFLAGMLLGAVYLLSGNLWLPTGLHLGWNWTVAVLFGLPVSGFDLPSFLEGRAPEGSGLLSGGAFGPEASLPAFAVLLPVAGAATLLALRRGCRVPVVARHATAPPGGGMIEATHPEAGDAPGA